MTNPTIATADSAYNTAYMEMQKNMERLKAMVEKHSDTQSRNKKNWGFVGDLAQMNAKVLEALGKE
jgi:hypothetical protein